MKKYMLLIGLSLCISAASWAATVTDDFDRPDVAYTTNMTLIGENWSLDEDSMILVEGVPMYDQYSISNGMLHVSSVAPSRAFNTEQETVSGDGTNFVLNVSMTPLINSRYMGVVFNYQNATNYYYFRIKSGDTSFHILRVVDGLTEFIGSGSASESFQVGSTYALAVESQVAHNFHVSVAREYVKIAEGQGTDTGNNFTGGYAGIMMEVNGIAAAYDDFSLSVGPMAVLPGATLITDTFNRPNGVNTINGADLGLNWVNESAGDQWVISAGALFGSVAAAPALLYNTGLQTISGNGTNMTLSVVNTCLQDNRYSGVVFNYQDENNYYYFRFKTGSSDYAVLKNVGGSLSFVKSGTASETFVANEPYTINVISRDAYDFWINMRHEGSVILQAHAYDSSESFTGGYAGLKFEMNGLGAKYDDFSLELSTPPTQVVDDFNRAPMPLTPVTAFLGGYWMQNGANSWSITNDVLLTNPGSTPAVLFNNAFTLGTTFTLSADVAAEETNAWVGVAFNYQDDGNFYYLRIKPGSPYYQLIGEVGGNETAKVMVSDAATETFAAGTYYTLTVSSSSPYAFDFSITEVGSATVLNGTTHVEDNDSNFTGGYAGLYSPSTSRVSMFDNFSLSQNIGGYADWAGGWGVPIGAETEDYDKDGVSNIYEYGLGGDPTNPSDLGVPSIFSVSGGVATYIHPRLSDPNSGLSYSLELSTDLVVGSWTNAGYSVSGTNVTGGDLNYVTNVTDTAEAEKFIRLIIE